MTVGAQAPQDDTNNNHHQHPTPTGWAVRGKLTLQRHNKETLAAAVSINFYEHIFFFFYIILYFEFNTNSCNYLENSLSPCGLIDGNYATDIFL